MNNEVEANSIFSLREKVQFVKRGRLAIFVASFLVLAFWLVDWFFIKGALIWDVAFLRLLVVPVALLCLFMFKTSLFSTKYEYIPGHIFCLFLGVYNAILVAWTGYEESSYYAGLNLVAFGSLFFLPWNLVNSIVSVFLIYFPYIITVVFFNSKSPDLSVFVPTLAFCGSTIVLGFVTMDFTRKLRISEYKSRIDLDNELKSKEEEIKRKTKEGVLFEKLSKQFSPSVIENLKINPTALDQMIRSQVTSVFIDIEKSTNRASRLDHDSYTSVVDDFLSNAARILLSHNLTIGAYLGDGLLAFANVPLSQRDHQVIAVKSAIDILSMHGRKREIYQAKWRNDFNVRIGITTGYASTGFFPSETKSTYTAVGTDVNLASRLCSLADANSIALLKSFGVALISAFPDIQISYKGIYRDIKGFEGENIEVITVTSILKESPGDACPQCSGKMIVQSTHGAMILLLCQVCGYRDLKEV